MLTTRGIAPLGHRRPLESPFYRCSQVRRNLSMSNDNPLLPRTGKVSPLRPLPNLIFASRWLQLPLYLGLIVAQAVYVLHFLVELTHLVEAAFGSKDALE